MNKNQRRTLDFIKEFIEKHGYSPSYEEIGEGISAKSKSEVSRHILNLEKLGHITRIPNQSRSIELVRHAQAGLLTYQQLVHEAAVRGYKLTPITEE